MQRLVGPLVLSLFDLSTNFVMPWADAGYHCLCVDIQHPPGETTEGNIIKIGADVLEWLPPRAQYAFVAAWPPCTHLAVSGARWFAGKGLGKLAESIRLFHRAAAICEWAGAPYIIENPVSVISSHWRKPDHAFQPWEYGDLTSKKTCLWTGGGLRDADPANYHQAGRRRRKGVAHAALARPCKQTLRNADGLRPRGVSGQQLIIQNQF